MLSTSKQHWITVVCLPSMMPIALLYPVNKLMILSTTSLLDCTAENRSLKLHSSTFFFFFHGLGHSLFRSLIFPSSFPGVPYRLVSLRSVFQGVFGILSSSICSMCDFDFSLYFIIFCVTGSISNLLLMSSFLKCSCLAHPLTNSENAFLLLVICFLIYVWVQHLPTKIQRICNKCC